MMDALTSRVVSFLRFPLIVAVIFIHCNLGVGNPEIERNFWYVLLITFTFKIVCIAVPVFFFISGFLFFRESIFTLHIYKRKLISRLHTLIIPYLLWNAIYFGIIALLQKANSNFLFLLHKRISEFVWQDYFWVFWDISKISHLPDDQHACLVGAFWFLQCLFLLFLASPIIYYVIKFTKHTFPIILILLYILDCYYEYNIPGIQINAIIFFSLGAYLSITNISFITFLKRIPVTASLSMILLILCITVLIDNSHVYFLTDLVLDIAIFSLVANYLEFKNWEMPPFLVSSVFFVFAVHRLISASLMRISRTIVPLINNDFLIYLYYLLMVVITLAFSLILFSLLMKKFPKLCNILNGKRAFYKL